MTRFAMSTSGRSIRRGLGQALAYAKGEVRPADSRRNPQFNREDLRVALKAQRIHYVFLGEELGARSHDECCYVNDKVSYALLAKTPLFQSGIDRVLQGALGGVVVRSTQKHPPDNPMVINALQSLSLSVL